MTKVGTIITLTIKVDAFGSKPGRLYHDWRQYGRYPLYTPDIAEIPFNLSMLIYSKDL